MFMSYIGQLAKAAARMTSKSKSVKVFKPGGDQALHEALHRKPEDGRQAPWTYGERRNRFKGKQDARPESDD